MSEPSYVCVRCKDTHRMMDFRYEHPVSCTSCPTPCDKCRQGRTGAYCESTPCDCDCHKEHSVPNTKMPKLTLEGVRNGLDVVSNQIDSLSKKLDKDRKRFKNDIDVLVDNTYKNQESIRHLKIKVSQDRPGAPINLNHPVNTCEHKWGWDDDYGGASCVTCGIVIGKEDALNLLKILLEN